MSTDATTNTEAQVIPTHSGTENGATSPQSWEPLPQLERRILGVLVEKQKTSKTADAYPLTLNALVTGCNQKSNRDPVLELDEVEVEDGIASLQKKGLVVRITGGRAERFKHTLYENWTKVGSELAVLSELLLRGPQTKGDLRVRASRMDPIETQEALDDVLQPLVARRLVIYLNDPDRRGALITHGFHMPDEMVRLKAVAANAPTSVAEPVAPARPTPPTLELSIAASLEAKLTTAFAAIDALKSRVEVLEKEVVELRKQFGLT